MPPSEPSRIVISYARRDGADLAKRLQKDLDDRGFDVWLDTRDIGGGRVWSHELDRAIDACDVMLAVLTTGSYESRMCSGEQLRALDKGKRLIPVLAAKSADRTTYLYSLELRDFTNDALYPETFAQLLADIRGDATATLPDAYRHTRVTYLTAPPRVANYLERPEALHALRDLLLADYHRQPIALTALAGMGGIGKTVLAKGLTEDPVVQRAFPDGIVWITAGKERKRDFIAEMREVAKALGDDLSGYDNDLACENQYRTTMANKAALIVVDDVWSKTDIEPLLAESPRSRFLFTTRDAAIGNLIGARDHRADLLDDAQSRELLALWANQPFSELPAVADEIIRECGRLPLALSVLGGMLRGKNAQYWADTLARLRKADISSIRKQLPTGQETFFKAVETSFQSLEPEMQEQYKALAVLLEDMPAPLPILATLWNVDTSDARLISNRLVELSLAQLEGATESIRLHDLQLDYVRAQYPDKEALDLIHGAMRLSSNVITDDPLQFASQMVGRLLPYHDKPAITEFTQRVAASAQRPWLRPLHPALHPPGTTLIRTLTGHTGFVDCVALTRDGRIAVSGSQDETLRVWDVGSGREIRTLQGHTGWVHAVAVSGDGRIAVSASQDQTLKVWEVGSGRELHTLPGHTGRVNDVALSGDGRIAVSASSDQTLKVWDVASGRELHNFIGHLGEVCGVAVSADGRIAVSASDDQTLKVWDLASGRELHTLSGHAGRVCGVALTVDGCIAVSSSWDQTMKVWDVASGLELLSRPASSGFRGVALSGDGQTAVLSSFDKTLKVWDVASGRELRTLSGHAGQVIGVALSGESRIAVSASEDQTLKVWNLASIRESDAADILPGHGGSVRDVALSGDGQTAVSYDDTLKVWDVANVRQLRTFSGDTGLVLGVALSGDGRIAVSASYRGMLKVWDVGSGRELHTLPGHTGRVNDVALSGDGRIAVSASSDQTLKVWDVASGRELHNFIGHLGEVCGVAVSADGRIAVSASSDQTLKVWDLSSGRELRTLSGHKSYVRAVTLSRNGRIAVSASWDHMLKVWEVAGGRELHTLTGHAGYVDDVALGRDGRIAVSASRDHTFKVWDLTNGKCLATFTCDGAAYCCAYSDALKLIVAGDAGGHVHFLRLIEPHPKEK